VPFLSPDQLSALGFRHLGRSVRISDRAAIYTPEHISIGDFSRIDDFCVLSGRVTIGRNVHVAVMSNIAGGEPGVTLGDFAGLAYGCQLFAQSDDYSGRSLTNPTVPPRFKPGEIRLPIHIGRHCILGTYATVFPGVTIGEGTSVGALSLVTKSTDVWSVYAGRPARRMKARHRDILELEAAYLASDDA
jgi:galactoside O-acetyltransferase